MCRSPANNKVSGRNGKSDRMKSQISALVLALSWVGCGAPRAPEAASASHVEPTAAAPAEPAPAETAEAKSWDRLNLQERGAYMANVVLPKMSEAFAEFSPAEYGGKEENQEPKFSCETCHGENRKAVKFRMPNTLRPLSAPNPIPAAMEYDAHVTQFMQQKVVPLMAKLLGKAPASAENPKGFGCFGCHQKE